MLAHVKKLVLAFSVVGLTIQRSYAILEYRQNHTRIGFDYLALFFAILSLRHFDCWPFSVNLCLTSLLKAKTTENFRTRLLYVCGSLGEFANNEK